MNNNLDLLYFCIGIVIAIMLNYFGYFNWWKNGKGKIN